MYIYDLHGHSHTHIYLSAYRHHCIALQTREPSCCTRTRIITPARQKVCAITIACQPRCHNPRFYLLPSYHLTLPQPKLNPSSIQAQPKLNPNPSHFCGPTSRE